MRIIASACVGVALVCSAGCAAKSGAPAAAEDSAGGAAGDGGAADADGAEGGDGADGADGTDGTDGTEDTGGAEGAGGTGGADGADGADGTADPVAAGTYAGQVSIDVFAPSMGIVDRCTGAGTLTVTEAGGVSMAATCGDFSELAITIEISGAGAMVTAIYGEGALEAPGIFGSAPFTLDFVAGPSPMAFALLSLPYGTVAGVDFSGTLAFTSAP